ncbi:MAG: hypothetical protein ACK2UK_18650 [Candidatus Promineifilaceae bacterium]
MNLKRMGTIRRPAPAWKYALLLGAVLVFALAACADTQDSGALSELEIKLTEDAAPAAVQEPASQDAASDAAAAQEAVAETAPVDNPTTAPAENGAPAATNQPVVESASVTPDAALQGAAATATARAGELAATSEAAGQANAASALATSEAMAPILEELASLGVDPNQGELGFVHPPISLEVTDFESSDFANRNAFTVAKDFVMAADVTWESRFAESGCGFVVRSDGEEESPSQYIIGLTRGAEGHALFAEQIAGDVEMSDVTDIYANGIDPLFEWQSGTTNRLVVIGRGQEFTLFSNGTRLGTVTGKAGFEEGFVAFIAVNRSGGIKCDFNNAWLWKLD